MKPRSTLAFLFLFYPALSYPQSKLSDAEALKLVKTIDDKERNSGDFKGLCFVKETEKGQEPKVIQAVYYRRDKDNKFLLLITKPKEDAGKGYLKIDKNLWMYTPSTGKWDRRTEREKIGGTNSRRSDFDEKRLSEEYQVKYVGEEKIGKYTAHKLELLAKEESQVSYPKLIMLIDKETVNTLKIEEYALSGKLMRSTYYPQWSKEFSKSKNDYVWVPKEMRIFDELEKGNSTVILIKEVDFSELPDSVFSKAWIESKSR